MATNNTTPCWEQIEAAESGTLGGWRDELDDGPKFGWHDGTG